MKRTRLSLLLAAVLALGCEMAICQSRLPGSGVSAATVLPDGYPIELATARTVSSESDNPGELVEFVVKHDVVVGDVLLLPEGTSVYGRVVASRLNDRAKGLVGMLEFRLESLKLANGQEIPLRTIRTLPTEANADLSPEKLTNLVNSPYAPFAHFTNLPIVTVPKNSLVTLYVAADVNVGSQLVVASYVSSQSDSLAAHIVHSNSGAKSLGEIAREQREHGKISGGMVSGTQ
jgi:hypothetical protein